MVEFRFRGLSSDGDGWDEGGLVLEIDGDGCWLVGELGDWFWFTALEDNVAGSGSSCKYNIKIQEAVLRKFYILIDNHGKNIYFGQFDQSI